MIKSRRSTLFSTVAFAGIGALGACSTAPTAPTATAAPSSSNSASAQGLSRPSWALSSALSGRVDGSQKIAIQVHLAMRNQSDAVAELAAIGDPENAKYGHFLSDDEFDAKYGPTAADVAAVRALLESHGLSVTDVPDNRAYVAAEGSADQAESAFATHLGLYTVKNETRRAPIEQPTLPAALQGRVSAVLGLATSPTFTSHRVKLGGIKRSAILAKGTQADDVPADTCSEWFGQIADTVDPAYPGYGPLTYSICGYHPAQLRNAYGFNASIRGGNDGKGQSIAIVDAFLSPTLLTDAQTYAANNDPDYPLKKSQLQIVQAPGTVQTPDTGWYGEQTLDVEAAHAMAPGAKIVAVVAQSPTDQDLSAAINLVVSKKLATVISNSWDGLELGEDLVVWQSIAQQANLKGVGLYFSSGDNGDESSSTADGSPTPDFPASLAEVTAVGGTSLMLSRNGQIAFESGWETGFSILLSTDASGNSVPPFWSPAPPGTFYAGSGGGASYAYLQPSWQKGIVPAAMANIYHPTIKAPARVVPDVAMLGDPETGFFVGQTDPDTGVYGEYPIGGTSLSCPLFVGTMALAQQNAGRSFGNANALLYKASKKGAFRDITPPAKPQGTTYPGGVVVTYDWTGQEIATAKGYDNTTGLGAPNGQTFLNNVK